MATIGSSVALDPRDEAHPEVAALVTAGKPAA
jgi:hypothetical protein